MAEHDIIDGSIRNEISLHRFIRREVRLILELFENFDKKVARLIRREYREGMDFFGKAFAAILAAIKDLRDEMMREARRRIRKTLVNVGRTEHDKEWAILLAALGMIDNKPRPPRVSEALKEPFASGASSASTLGKWLLALKAVDFARIRDALNLAVRNGESTDLAVARVIGSRDRQYRDGAAAITRNNIRALIATAIVHVVDFFRRDLWTRTPQVVGMVWVSVLDGRTTPVCRARDNKIVMFGNNPAPDGASLLIPQGARPPAHPNCRSRMVAFTEGAIPTRETFDDFLRSQSRDVQEDILGVAKAKLYRDGKVTLDGFVDDTGKELTLTQLKAA